ncbi:MAG: hypothetical protein ACRC8Y_11595 [Chroococcales cyanobacterium]
MAPIWSSLRTGGERQQVVTTNMKRTTASRYYEHEENDSKSLLRTGGRLGVCGFGICG